MFITIQNLKIRLSSLYIMYRTYIMFCEGEFYILYIISTSKSWNISSFSDVSELFEADVNHYRFKLMRKTTTKKISYHSLSRKGNITSDIVNCFMYHHNFMALLNQEENYLLDFSMIKDKTYVKTFVGSAW